MNKSNVVIEIKDLDFFYGQVPVLENINFSATANELICIVGPNGGGKTTLLKLIAGLLRPNRGQINVFGNPPLQAQNRIGYMPQNPQHDRHFPISVLEVVLMGRLGGLLFGPYKNPDRKIAYNALREVEMHEYAARPFSDLSGGQRQRVLIARALSTNPELLLLDEPAANVDPEQEKHLHDILKRLKSRMTILMVTHDFVPEMVEEVVCVNRSIEIHPTSRLTPHGDEDIHSRAGRVVRHDRNIYKTKKKK